MKGLMENILSCHSISIIGMAKNVGKTTTLNYIIEKLWNRYTLGITSIGRDGESEDVVTKTSKPKIYIQRGTYVATAKACLFHSDITREILETTGINTPMGEVIIIKALSDGYIDLAGPSINTELKLICEKLKKYGSDLVIADGALSRKTFASPHVTKGTILCTGAALSGNIEKVVESTKHTIDLLRTKELKDKGIKKQFLSLIEDSKLTFIRKNGDYKKIELDTILGGAKIICDELMDEATKYVLIKGILIDQTLDTIMKTTDLYKGRVFIVEDGTKLFISKEMKYKFEKRGGEIRVLNPIHLIGVSINPTSPYGYSFNNELFMDLLAKGIDLPIFNVMGCE